MILFTGQVLVTHTYIVSTSRPSRLYSVCQKLSKKLQVRVILFSLIPARYKCGKKRRRYETTFETLDVVLIPLEWKNTFFVTKMFDGTNKFINLFYGCGPLSLMHFFFLN